MSPEGPGILTATQEDPTGGLDHAFEFTGNNSTYSSASASVNDVQRLTGGTRFTLALTSPNELDICFSSLSPRIYTGGFFTDQPADFYDQIKSATIACFVKTTGAGDTTFNGSNYLTAAHCDPRWQVTVCAVVASADFGGGAVNGRVMEFEYVSLPEPGTITLLGIGAAFALATVGRRRWQRRRR
jgi:hypothetical protein